MFAGMHGFQMDGRPVGGARHRADRHARLGCRNLAAIQGNDHLGFAALFLYHINDCFNAVHTGATEHGPNGIENDPFVVLNYFRGDILIGHFLKHACISVDGILISDAFKLFQNDTTPLHFS